MEILIKNLKEANIRCRKDGEILRVICENGNYIKFHEIMLKRGSEFKSDDVGFSVSTILLGKAYIVRKYGEEAD